MQLQRFRIIISRVLFCFRMGVRLSDRLRLLYATIKYSVLIRSRKGKIKISNDLSYTQYRIRSHQQSLNLHLRLQDLSMFYEVWMDQCYHPRQSLKPQIILDLGAHVGLTTLYFYHLFGEDTQYISVEGSHKNAEVLQLNLGTLPNISIIKEIITSDGRDVVYDERQMGHLHKISQTKGTLRSTINIHDLWLEFALNKVDLCKMDVEGAEVELLSSSTSWANRVKYFMIERHQEYGLSEMDQHLVHHQRITPANSDLQHYIQHTT